jgi:hypothetical protein
VFAVDVTGDFSPVQLGGWLQRYLHSSQHEDEHSNQDPAEANIVNQNTNLHLMSTFSQLFKAN